MGVVQHLLVNISCSTTPPLFAPSRRMVRHFVIRHQWPREARPKRAALTSTVTKKIKKMQRPATSRSFPQPVAPRKMAPSDIGGVNRVRSAKPPRRPMVALLPDGLPHDVTAAVNHASFRELMATVQSPSFGSEINQCWLAYQEMLLCTRNLGFPNALRTSFVCAVLDQLLSHDRFRRDDGEHLFDLLKADLFASLYSNTTPATFLPSAVSRDTEFHRFRSCTHYFIEHGIVVSERDALLHELTSKRSSASKELVLMERIIRRWQSMLLDRMFQAWRNIAKRRKLWLLRLDSAQEQKCAWQRLRTSFRGWCAVARQAKLEVELNETRAQLNEKSVSEEALVREYAKLISGIESLKIEKSTLQDSVRRLTDEVSSLRTSVELLQSRLESQRAANIAWKELSVSALRLLQMGTQAQKLPSPATGDDEARSASAPVPSASVLTAAPSLGGLTSNLSSWTSAAHQELQEAPDPVLQWINAVRTEHLRSKTNAGIVESIPEVTNFTSDFANGGVVLELAEATGAVDSAIALRLRKFVLRRPSVVVRSIVETVSHQRQLHLDLPFVVESILSGMRPAAVRHFMTQWMVAADRLCPICSRSETLMEYQGRRDSAAAMREEGFAGNPSDIRSRIEQAIGQQRAHRTESQALLDSGTQAMLHEAVAAEKATRFLASVAPGIEFIANSLMNKAQDEMLDVTCTALEAVCRRMVTRIWTSFDLVGRGKESTSSVECWHALMVVKSVFKFSIRKLTTTLIDELCHAVGSFNALEQAVVNGVAWCAVVCWLGLANHLHTIADHNNDLASVADQEKLITAIATEIEIVLSAIDGCGAFTARKQFESVCCDANVQAVASAATSTLARLWTGTSIIAPEFVDFDRCAAMARELKIVGAKGVTVDSLRQLFEFVTVVPAAKIDFNGFVSVLIGVALLKDSAPWIAPAAKLKQLLDLSKTKKHPV